MEKNFQNKIKDLFNKAIQKTKSHTINKKLNLKKNMDSSLNSLLKNKKNLKMFNK